MVDGSVVRERPYSEATLFSYNLIVRFLGEALDTAEDSTPRRWTREEVHDIFCLLNHYLLKYRDSLLLEDRRSGETERT